MYETKKDKYETCPVCGKIFYIGMMTEWIYKKYDKNAKSYERRKLFCGWNCMRKWEKANEGR
jgi:hypothetical protein